ncbi:hypothetical protein B7R54_06030 [Subtercola boreus]|uniref:O-antigen ligase-related domain-containing protein n=1 Tax=Subtercola boreus TaxID=120213 RepID=A0A3E0VFZ7_9MICO|nr:hypothetical protein B7R54_06030 [Subtercola boreus]
MAALETLGLRPIPSDLDRPGSLLGNATDQGIVGVMFAALLVLPALAPRMPGPGAATRGGGASRATGAERPAPPRPRAAGTLWLLRAGLLAAALSTVLSASRAATAALFAVAVVASVVLVARRASGDRRSATVHALLALAGIAGLVAAVLLVPLSRERIFDVAALDPARLGDRFTIWREAAQLLWANPLLGVGPSGYLDQIAAVHSATWFFDVGSGVTIDSPHNLLLQAGLAGGIPLLLCLGALAVLSAVTAWRRIRSGDDAVLGATLALLGFTIVLLTHFTAPATTLLAALLLGMVVARPADVPIGSVATRTPTASRFPAAPRGRAGRGLRMLGVTALAASTLLVAVSCSAEVALGAGVSAAADSRLADADAAFATAAALRPWDADTRSIAAQSFAQAADSGQPGAPGLAGSWAARALDLAPDSVLSAKALAVSQQYSGDLDGALETLTALDDRAPNDPETLHRLGGVQFLDGRIPDAQQALERAVAVDPDDADAWLTLQYVYQQTGDSAGFARASGELARLGRN